MNLAYCLSTTAYLLYTYYLLTGGVGTVSTISRLNKDGVWEKVVSVNDDTREELGKMNWMAKQLTGDESMGEGDEESGINRRIRLGEES